MAEVIEFALHGRTRRILQLFLRRQGLDFFLENRTDEHFSRIDPRKIDLVLTLADRSPGPVSPQGDRLASPRSMVRRILIRRMAVQLVETGH